MKIVTTGTLFMDIDGYAGSIAYAELLNREEEDARAAVSSTLNASVTPTVSSWPADFQVGYESGLEDKFVLVDCSDYHALDAAVDVGRVVEVLDHHPGFESYWHERLSDKAHIEPVGAASTLVCEAWQDYGALDHISQTSARLLVCGILDNTLNFGAQITTQRDRAAYTELLKHANLPADWPAQYFSEVAMGILADVTTAVANDTKLVDFPGQEGPVAVGQLAIWDAERLVADHLPEIKAAVSRVNMRWFANIICISEGKSYIVCENPQLQKWLSGILGVQFTNNLAVASRPWLRKEMVRAALQQAGGGQSA
jgi:DHH family putative phosphoesterase